MEILNQIYTELATIEEKSEGSEPGLQAAENKWLAIVDQKLESVPDDLVLEALKAELLMNADPGKSAVITRRLLNKLIGRSSAAAATARGICFYVCAMIGERRRKNADSRNFFRQSLENYPGHWNAAVMFAGQALDDDKLFQEALAGIDEAGAALDDRALKASIYRRAAGLCFNEGQSPEAVKYYELLRSHLPFDARTASRAAFSYARILNFSRAFRFFKLSWRLELADDERERKLNPDFIKPMRGYDVPELWQTVEDLVKVYDQDPSSENLVLVGTGIKYLPAELAKPVFDSVKEKLVGKSPVIDFFEAMDHGRFSSAESIRDYSLKFERMVEAAVEELNKRLCAKQPGETRPFLVKST